jgi:hypothetical protein
MRKLITLLLMLSGVLAYGQSLTFKTYKNGQVIGSKTIKYPTKVITKVVFKYIPVTKIKNLLKNVDVQLGYQVGGFTDKKYIRVLAEQSSPSSINDSIIVPDSDYSEEIAYLKVVSQFDLAESTIESRQRERYGDAVKFYLELIDKYPSSAYLKLSEKMYTTSLKEVARLTAVEAEQKALQEKKQSNTSKVTTSPQ